MPTLSVIHSISQIHIYYSVSELDGHVHYKIAPKARKSLNLIVIVVGETGLEEKNKHYGGDEYQ